MKPRNKPNLLVDGNRITCIGNVGHGVVLASFLAFTATLGVFFLIPPEFGFGYGVAALQLIALPDMTAAALHNFLNWSRRTVFDGDERAVLHANMAGRKPALPFAETAEPVRVRAGTGEQARYFYTIARAGRRFGRGWVLCPPLPAGSPELERLEKAVVPALSTVIGEAKRDASAHAAAPGVDTPKRHRLRDGVYSRATRKKTPFFFVMALLLLGAPIVPGLHFAVLLSAHVVFSIFSTVRIRIVPETRSLTLYPSFPGKGREISFDDVVGFERIQGVSMFQPIHLHLRYRANGVEQTTLFCCNYRSTTVEAILAETEAIMNAGGHSSGTRHSRPSNPFNSSPSSRTP